MSRDRDDLIKHALTPTEPLTVPPTLLDGIGRAIRATPQERPGIWSFRLAGSGAARRTTIDDPPRGGPARARHHGAPGRIVVAARPGQRADVPGRPDRTSVMPGPGPRGVPIQAATYQLTTGAVPWTASPVVGGGRVFVVDDSGFGDRARRRRTWGIGGRSTSATPIRSSPVLVGDRLVVGSDGGDVVALDVADGAQDWTFPTGGPVSGSLAFADGTLYVPSEDGTLYALGMDGTERWRSDDLGAPLDRGPAVARRDRLPADQRREPGGSPGRRWHADLGVRDFDTTGVTTPSVIDGTVYVGLGLEAPDEPQALVAVSSSDGSTMWTWSSPAGHQVAVAAVDHGTVLVSAKDEGIASLEPVHGQQRWMTPIPDSASVGGALVDGTLVTVADDGSVIALDAASGSTPLDRAASRGRRGRQWSSTGG